MSRIFLTSKGTIVSGKELENAVTTLIKDWKILAYEVYIEDAYADHVTEDQKVKILMESIAEAEKLSDPKQDLSLFYIWQPLNYILTGECPGLLDFK